MALDKVVDSAALDAGMTSVADAIRAKAGTTDMLVWPDGFAAAINAITTGGGEGGGVKITEYIVTENADRSLWLNEQGIKLVKGVNLLVSSKFFYNTSNAPYAQGAVTVILLLWDGVAGTANVQNNTYNNKSHIRGCQLPQGVYAIFGTVTHLNVGNTTAINIAEDGSLTCTTSATGATTGNYNNSFIEGGYTYYLVQVPSEEVC